MSSDLKIEIESYHIKLVKQIKRLGKFFDKYDHNRIDKILTKSKKYKDLEEKYRVEHIKRSNSGEGSEKEQLIYRDLMDMLKEISIFIDLIVERLSLLEVK